MGLLFRSMNIQFTHMNTRINDTRVELSNRLQRVETRVDEIGRDIGDLRDRTGKLEGSLTTFMQNRGKIEAA